MRESYVLLVDMYFGISTSVKDNLNKFNKLIDKLDKANDILLKDEYEALNERNFIEREIADLNLGISRLINDNVQNGDVFWQFLYLMYKSIFIEDEKIYFESWVEEGWNDKNDCATDNYDLYYKVIVKDFSGNTLSEEVGDLYQAADGTWWIA